MTNTKFEQLVHEHQDAVYRQMVRVCSHKEDAEDALGSALLLAFQASETLSTEASFQSWLTTIGRRVCYRMRSNPKVLQALEYADEVGITSPAEEEDSMDIGVLKGCVHQAVDGLAPIYKEIYMRCELDEQTVPEAAQALGITHAAAKSRLLRARALVRDFLSQSICGAPTSV